ncbi:MAG: AAA domain-containing protein [Lachnospiraceae bacterium]|nr:AAA domain-containing protein [Lachnospiraceae bacterium]
MEYIDRIFYRKINPSDFKKLYDIDKPEGGGGQTYLEAAGIDNESIVDFLNYAEMSDSPLDGEVRSIYTFNAHVLGNSRKAAFIEFAPRKGRSNYRISRQNMKYKHPAWSIDNGFPEPLKDRKGAYTSDGNFKGIIDDLLITIIRTTYKKYYAGFINANAMPESWPVNVGLERIFEGERRGVLPVEEKSIEFVDSLNNPFGKMIDTSLSKQIKIDEEGRNNPICFQTGLESEFPRNRILFGAPGTGKSFSVNRDRKKLLGEENETDYERVTFHPDYSYANFVGTYKPVMVFNKKASLDQDTDDVISVLNDKGKSAQEKYDLLFERFKGEGLTRLPILLGLYTDESFKTRKQDGSDAVGDNIVERNHGKAIRKYVNLIRGQETTGDIAYEYVPGPFMRVYVNALKSARTGKPKPHLLIIEEINRANVAAVFGDVFQLLDRGEDEISEYPIQASEDIKGYLAKELGGEPDDYSKIRIPDNLFIWATMNSADQGVFPMDTAFKRRWDFTYLGIDDSDKDIRGKFVTVGSKEKQRIEWNELRKAINEFLADEKINEDKQLGPYFIARNIVIPADGGSEINSVSFCDVFKHKVLMYLFDDAAKQKRGKLFQGSAKGQTRYSKICEAFDEQGIGIFNADIQRRVKIQDLMINAHEVDENGMVKTEADTESEGA